MTRAAVLALLLVGCNQLYGLEPTQLPETPRDDDGDGVLDAVDNCVGVANESQDDLDGDGKGDACDNCAFLRNATQSDVDGDAIGDACDPHPEDAADCLILVDTFADPATFAGHWSILAEAGDTPDVTPGGGGVRLVPHPPRRVGMIARHDDGTVLGGVFDVLVRGRVTISDGATVSAVSNAARIGTGYSCSLRGGTPIDSPVVASANGTSTPSAFSGALSSEAIDDTYVLRLIATAPRTQPYPDQCRVDYGVAVGERTVAPTQMPVGGGAGVIADRDPTDIEAVALYQYGRTPCPVPIIR